MGQRCIQGQRERPKPCGAHAEQPPLGVPHRQEHERPLTAQSTTAAAATDPEAWCEEVFGGDLLQMLRQRGPCQVRVLPQRKSLQTLRKNRAHGFNLPVKKQRRKIRKPVAVHLPESRNMLAVSGMPNGQFRPLQAIVQGLQKRQTGGGQRSRKEDERRNCLFRKQQKRKPARYCSRTNRTRGSVLHQMELVVAGTYPPKTRRGWRN